MLNVGFAGSLRVEAYPPAVTLFIFFCLALLAVIRYNFGKNLHDSFLAYFNYRQSIRLLDERRESDRQAGIFLNILFSLAVGLFISFSIGFFGTQQLFGSYTISILFFSFASGLLYFFKAQIWKTLGAIFLYQSFSKIYIFNMYLNNRILGLMIFPLVAVVPYISIMIAQYIMYVAFGLIAIWYLFKLLRIFQIISVLKFSVIYFILYLCALEILPLLLFVKGCKVLSENIVVQF